MNEGIDSLSFPEEEDPDWDLDEDEIEVAENGWASVLAPMLRTRNMYGRRLALLRDEDEGQTMLHHTLNPEERSDRSDMIRLLVSDGADVNAFDNDLVTPLHITSFRDETELLIDMGADVNARDKAGWTPLFYTATQNRPDRCLPVARVLLRRGADLVFHSENDEAEELLELARLEQNWPFLELCRAVRLAGSWRNYANAPRVELVRLRLLCARGRANPPPARREPILARLFAAGPPPPSASTKKSVRLASRPVRRPLPNEIFWLVLSFWRTSRDG